VRTHQVVLFMHSPYAPAPCQIHDIQEIKSIVNIDGFTLLVCIM